jgi:hypothetical protein
VSCESRVSSDQEFLKINGATITKPGVLLGQRFYWVELGSHGVRGATKLGMSPSQGCHWIKEFN